MGGAEIRQALAGSGSLPPGPGRTDQTSSNLRGSWIDTLDHGPPVPPTLRFTSSGTRVP